MMALVCGLAIMMAGAVFLFQLTTQDELAAPIPIGEPVGVGDMTVTVTDITESDDGRLAVLIEIGGTQDDQPADEFRMIASGRPVTVEQTTCLATDGAAQECTVTFDVSGADGVSRVLFYERGDDRVRWVLG
jgi:hypothetical protein